ncbi:hypothetical protein [Streptomyces sp. NPDC012616]|uniref:hypothetical protein n=1 Tax=Streptomyces sp. NPDC012616 TaxID=3364840 RepID=UPI0036E28AA6
MASCRCGGGQCNCVVTAGPGATVTGAGSKSNPYVVGAQPSLTAGCGLSGTGTAADPIVVNTQAWPYACPVDAEGGGIYCDPASGELKGEPGQVTASGGNLGGATQQITWPGGACGSFTQVSERLAAATIINPSSCRPMLVTMQINGRLRADVDAAVHGDPTPPSTGINVFGEYRINGGGYTLYRNATWVTDATTQSVTATGGDDVHPPQTFTIPPGGSATIDTRIRVICTTANSTIRLVLNEPAISLFGVTS